MVNQSLRMNLVTALLECPRMRERSSREVIVGHLSPDLRDRIPRHETAHIDVTSIVGACCDWEGGLDELIRVVRDFETDKSIPFQGALEVYEQIKAQSVQLSTTPVSEVAIEPQQRGESSFVSLIQSYCAQIEWRISEIDDAHALLLFEMPTGRTQIVLLVPYESTLEFSVPSELLFDSEDDLPNELSTLLLLRNAQSKYAFWAIQETDGQCLYSCVHNAEMELLDALYFKTVVEALIGECDAFEQLLKDIDEEQPIGENEEPPTWLDLNF